MPKLYANGTTSDRSVSGGAILTPGQRTTALAAADRARETSDLAARKLRAAERWLAEARHVLPAGTGVAQSEVEAAAVAAGHQVSDVRTALLSATGGRFIVSGSTITRRA